MFESSSFSSPSVSGHALNRLVLFVHWHNDAIMDGKLNILWFLDAKWVLVARAKSIVVILTVRKCVRLVVGGWDMDQFGVSRVCTTIPHAVLKIRVYRWVRVRQLHKILTRINACDREFEKGRAAGAWLRIRPIADSRVEVVFGVCWLVFLIKPGQNIFRAALAHFPVDCHGVHQWRRIDAFFRAEDVLIVFTLDFHTVDRRMFRFIFQKRNERRRNFGFCTF